MQAVLSACPGARTTASGGGRESRSRSSFFSAWCNFSAAFSAAVSFLPSSASSLAFSEASSVAAASFPPSS